MSEYKNSLASEKSPYLQQHASNPVAWQPWGEEAFARASAQDKPIFLSIGYSTCHWCHVMERESFENRATADFLNRHFIAIKVDREERPDIDKIYMDVVVATTGSGGWPLSVFLTPDGKPIYGGTYFPVESRWGMPGFLDVAASINEAWETQREKILQSAEGIVRNVINRAETPGGRGVPADLPHRAYRTFLSSFDAVYGGFSRAPKFPSPHNLCFLLNYHCLEPESKALGMVTNTLVRMCRGGICDQLGGGFHRYSVDPFWRVPHFEKMLYDQAGLAATCTDAWLLTGDPLFADAAGKTLDYVRRDMLSPEGLFYSAEDADSCTSREKTVKREGAFYLWSQAELAGILTDGEFEAVKATYGIKAEGNIEDDPHGEFAGMNILHAECAATSPLLESARAKLFAVRQSRVRPHLDAKSLVSWNAMMISAFAKAACAFDNMEYAGVAKKAAQFILLNLMDGECNLKHRYIEGEAAIDGMLEDYAFLAAALLDLYRIDYEIAYLKKAKGLTERMVELFWDADGHGFYTTSKPAMEFASRQRVDEDSAMASPSSVAIMTLFRLSRTLREPKYEKLADEQIDSISARLNSMPAAFASSLSALGFVYGGNQEFVLAEGDDPEATRRVDRLIKSVYFPNSVIVKRPCNPHNSRIELELMPWLKEMTPGEHDVALYICEKSACKMPAKGVEEAADAIARMRQRNRQTP